MTSRLLLEAGFSRLAYPGGAGTGSPDGALNLIQVVEQAAIDGHPANYGYRGINTVGDSYQNIKNWRGAASYVTGAHNLKVGYQGGYQRADAADHRRVALTYRFNNRRAEPVHVPAAGLPDAPTHDDVRALHPGHVDPRPAVAAGRAPLRPRLELEPGRGERHDGDVAVQRGADSVRADRRAWTPTTTSRRAAARPTTCSATAGRRSSSPSAATWRRRPTTRPTPRTTRRAASSTTPRGTGRTATATTSSTATSSTRRRRPRPAATPAAR